MNELQPSLFDEAIPPMVLPEYAKEATIQERFEAFHAANPHVYESLRALAFQMFRAGVTRYSVKSLFETLRWHYTLSTRGDTFRLNNDFTSHYARLLIEQQPELAGFFEVRALRERGAVE